MLAFMKNSFWLAQMYNPQFVRLEISILLGEKYTL